MNQLIPTHENDNGSILVSGRDLHEFLEIGTEYAKWISRMVEYGFEENIDFVVIVKNDENSLVGRKSANHHLKIDMAKEISMIQRNEKGKQARKYFIEVEKKFKSQSNTTQFSPQLQFLIQMEQRQNALEETVTTIQDTLLNRDEDWRKSINTMLNRSAFKLGGQYRDLRKKSYEILEERAHCNLNQRLRNMLDRLEQSGATKTTINNASKLDVIENDVRLKEIYTTIVKELSIGSLKISS